jgi:hypothetical protein
MASMTFSAPGGRNGILYTAFKANFKEKSALLRDLFLGSIGYRQIFLVYPWTKA